MSDEATPTVEPDTVPTPYEPYVSRSAKARRERGRLQPTTSEPARPGCNAGTDTDPHTSGEANPKISNERSRRPIAMSANTAAKDEPVIVDSVAREDEITEATPAAGEKVVTKTAAKPSDAKTEVKTGEAATSATDAPAPDADTTKQYDEAYVKTLRDEAASARVKGKEKVAAAIEATRAEVEKELTEKWGRSLGLIKDDETPDPAKLLEQATEREKQAIADRDKTAKKLRDYDIKDAITTAANAHDGDLSILLPVLRGEGKLDDLDPTADDFASQVDALVSAAVDSNPKLRKSAQVAASRSSGDLSNGGNGSPKPNEPKSIDEMRKEAAKRLRRE